jgi:hypothetical protein
MANVNVAARFGLPLSLSLASLLAGESLANAQTFRGTVVDDSTKRPLESVTLVLLDAFGKELSHPPVRSDTAGRFVLHAGSTGRYRVRANRIGYEPLTSNVFEFVGGAVATINLAMSAVQTRLGTIVVTEERRLNRFELYSSTGFDLRRSAGNGKFLDTTDLREYERLPAKSLLVDHAGFNVHYEPPPRGSRFATTVAEKLVMFNGVNPDASMRVCFPEIWLDGFPVGDDSRLRNFGAHELFGIEVYSHLQLPPASIGADFGAEQGLRPRQTRCGIIAVWTKRYIDEMKAKEARRPPG